MHSKHHHPMDSDIANHSNYAFLTTSQSPPPPHSPPLTVPISSSPPLRNPKDQCFSCKRQGHWATECPNKTAKQSSPSSPSSTTNACHSPRVRCPCGRAFCLRKTSRTQRNPDRDFFSCPVNCGFFKWCDKLNNVISRAPMCPCGAGICSVNGDRTGPGPGSDEVRWYFACRIKKNLGACDFFQWADSEVNTMQGHGGERKGYSYLQSKFDAAINDLGEKELNSEMNLESLHAQSSENSSDLPTNTVHLEQEEFPNNDLVMQEVESLHAQSSENSSDLLTIAVHLEQEEFPNTDPVMQEIESNDPMTQGETQVFQPIAQSQYHSLVEPWMQIPVAENIITQGVFPSFDPVTSSEEVDASDSGGPFLLPHSVPCAESDLPPSETPVEDAQLSVGVFSDSSGLEENKVSSTSILKTFGLALFDIFEFMNPLEPEQMLKVAEATFISFQKLQIECGPFVEGVKGYIKNLSLLASIERSVSTGHSSQELIKQYESVKVKFDNVSRRHTAAEAAYVASKNHLQSLHEEISRVKCKLIELEKQFVACEAETSLLKARVDEVFKDTLESKLHLETASSEMAKALELEQQRESAHDAAKVALATARKWLEEQ